MKSYVIGDIHGEYDKLIKILTDANFDYENDRLISLGDLCDRGPKTWEVIELFTKIKNLILIQGNHDCMHKDTEFLTESGWKKFNEINNKEKIAQFDINTKEISYALPLTSISKKVDKLISIEGNNSKQIVTFEHDIIIDDKKIKAQEILNKRILEKRCILNGFINNDDYSINDNILKLIVWTLMDGTIVYKQNKKEKKCKLLQFKLSRPDKIENLKLLLEELNFKYTFKPATFSKYNKLQPSYIRIYSDFAKEIEKYIPNKKMPNWFRIVSKKQCNIILDTILKTVGSKSNLCGIQFNSINKDYVDFIQEMCIKNKYNCCIKKLKINNGFGKKEQYRLVISNYYKNTNYYKLIIEEIIYNDFVNCFTMPLGTLITRFEGKIAFTGNCWLLNFFKTKRIDIIWKRNGGNTTIASYTEHNYLNVKEHKKLLESALPYYIENNICFTHGGFDREHLISEQNPDSLCWDRELIEEAMSCSKEQKLKTKDNFDKIFLGHTPTVCWTEYISNVGLRRIITPIERGGIILLDTGCGKGIDYKLTLWNLDTNTYIQA